MLRTGQGRAEVEMTLEDAGSGSLKSDHNFYVDQRAVRALRIGD